MGNFIELLHGMELIFKSWSLKKPARICYEVIMIDHIRAPSYVHI